MLPSELENWLTDAGGVVVEKAARLGDDSLDAHEQLLGEVWLLDTEQRNGGISQYFCNWGTARWLRLTRLATASLPSFARFWAVVDRVVRDSADPYAAVLASATNLDGWYEAHQTQLVTELRTLLGSAPRKA